MSYDPNDFKARKPRPDDPRQADLFGSNKLRRREHPKTSHAAAQDVAPELGKLQAWALELVQSHPRYTVSEIAEYEELRDPRRLGRRLNELQELGLIRGAGERRCSITNRSCKVYEAI
jgi:predicted transcriptional regulator